MRAHPTGAVRETNLPDDAARQPRRRAERPSRSDALLRTHHESRPELSASILQAFHYRPNPRRWGGAAGGPASILRPRLLEPRRDDSPPPPPDPPLPPSRRRTLAAPRAVPEPLRRAVEEAPHRPGRA